MANRLNWRSQWLLRYLYGRLPLGYASINALPADAPLGISMANMRGLIRAGLVENGNKVGEFHYE